MNTILITLMVIFLFVIMGILNEILGELRLAKYDREDDRSQNTDWVNPKSNFNEEE